MEYDIINKANLIHQKAASKDDIEFIIAYADYDKMELVQIKSGMLKRLDECWIGSEETYNYMKEMTVQKTDMLVLDQNGKPIGTEKCPLIYDLANRFENVLKCKIDDTVGEEAVIVKYSKEENRFKYQEKFFIVSGFTPQTIIPGDDIGFDASVVDGGYTCSFYADKNNAVHKYFEQIDKNLCYYKGNIKDGKYCYLYLPRFEVEKE